MLPLILRYGLLAGLSVGLPLTAMIVILRGNGPSGALGMAIGYLLMLAALSFVFVAIKRRRDADQGGVIGFWHALSLGLGVSVVAAIVYALAWEAGCAAAGLDYGAAYAREQVAAARAHGASPGELARTEREMAAFRAEYANPAYRIPMTMAEILPVGVLVSLISAGLLSNRRFLPARRALG